MELCESSLGQVIAGLLDAAETNLYVGKSVVGE